MKNNKRPFVHVGNNLAMDFINTQIASNGENIDLLSCMNDLYEWALDINIELANDHLNTIDVNTVGVHIESQLEITDADIKIEEVHSFRRDLKDLITTHLNKEPFSKASLFAVNQYLLYAPCQKKLESVDQQFLLQPLDEQLSIRQLLGKIALEAATLLTSANGQHIKNCSNSKCVLMFVDTSRSKKRRWCSMDRCGNRAKANAFYHSNKSH